MQMHLHKRNWTKDDLLHEKVWNMRQFRAVGGRAFCMVAAFFLALSPLIHGLHLASCHHSHGHSHPCQGYAACTHLCCHGHECASERAEKGRAAIGNPRENESRPHDPSTCPICRAFAQLIKGQGLPSSPVDITPQKVQLKDPDQDRTFPDLPSFFGVHPRAPPAC